MSYLTIEQIQSNLRNYFKQVGLQENAYQPIRSRSGEKDILTIYIAGTRKKLLGVDYGGSVAARIELTTRSRSSYQNGVVNDVESAIPQIPSNIMRQAAEGKLSQRINGS